MYNGINLLRIKAPPREPVKCALKLLALLFTSEEMASSLMFASTRSTKPALDSEKVSMLFGKYVDINRHGTNFTYKSISQ